MVVSMKTYKGSVGKSELYELLDEGMCAMKEKRVRPFAEALADIREHLEIEGMLLASESSTSFWDNELDNEVWDSE